MKRGLFTICGTTLLIFTLFFLTESILRISGKYKTYSENSPNGGFWFEWGTERDSYHYRYNPRDTFQMDIATAAFIY